jgi:hypothetical protein
MDGFQWHGRVLTYADRGRCAWRGIKRVGLAAIALGVSLGWAMPASSEEVDVAIVFAVDYSSSVNHEIANLQREGHASALTSPEIIKAVSGNDFGCIAISYFEWSSPGQTRVILPWRQICSADDAETVAALIREKGDRGYVRRGRSGTSIAAAIDGASRLLDNYPGKAIRKVIDISANGDNNDGRPVDQARIRALEKGYVINAIIVPGPNQSEAEPLSKYFAENVIGGSGAFVIGLEGEKDYFTALRRKLVTEISYNIAR